MTLPEELEGPKWKLGGSLIGVNPGVGIRPLNRDSRIDSNMFVLKRTDDNEVLTEKNGEGDLNIDYARRAQLFLEVYNNDVDTAKGYQTFDLKEELGECGEYPYGFTSNTGMIKPCIFLKFNKIWGWDPKPIDSTDFDANEDWPTSFKDHWRDQDQNQIFVDCQGRYPADQEAIKAGMKYIPDSQAFPAKYFPFSGNKDAYHSPLVAVQFDASQMPLGQLIHVECRAYYKGVIHTTKTKTGMVQFEILLN